MADSKITALTALTAADPVNDMFPIVDVSDTSMAASGTTKRISANNILSSSPTASGALTVTGLVTAGSASITGDLTVDTSTLKVDSTNNRVGILTASPRSPYALDVLGNVALGDSTTTTSVRLKLDCLGTAGNMALMSFAAAGTNKVFLGLSGAFAADTSTDALIATDTAGAGIRFYVSDTGLEAMRLNSTANLVLKGGTVGANGVGVTFPATQVASSDANCLDDYEEGTWVGTLKGSVSDPTVAVTATGKYTKVGRQVTVTIYYNSVSTVGASGNVTIDGLPFAGSESFAGSSITFGLFATSTTLACWNVSTSIAFYITGNFVQATHSPGTGKYLTTTITYFV